MSKGCPRRGTNLSGAYKPFPQRCVCVFIKKQRVSRQRHSLAHSGVCPSVPGFPDVRYQVGEQTGESGVAVYNDNN